MTLFYILLLPNHTLSLTRTLWLTFAETHACALRRARINKRAQTERNPLIRVKTAALENTHVRARSQELADICSTAVCNRLVTEQAGDIYHPAPSSERQATSPPTPPPTPPPICCVCITAATVLTSSPLHLLCQTHSWLFIIASSHLPLLSSFLYIFKTLQARFWERFISSRGSTVCLFRLMTPSFSSPLSPSPPPLPLSFFIPLKAGLASCFTVTPWPYLSLITSRFGRRVKRGHTYIELRLRNVSEHPWAKHPWQKAALWQYFRLIADEVSHRKSRRFLYLHDTTKPFRYVLPTLHRVVLHRFVTTKCYIIFTSLFTENIY